MGYKIKSGLQNKKWGDKIQKNIKIVCKPLLPMPAVLVLYTVKGNDPPLGGVKLLIYKGFFINWWDCWRKLGYKRLHLVTLNYKRLQFITMFFLQKVDYFLY